MEQTDVRCYPRNVAFDVSRIILHSLACVPNRAWGRRSLSGLTSAATGNEAWRRRVEVLRDASRQLRTFKPE